VLRCSDAERERVASFLRDQAIEGRLTADELDERVGRAYAAVTRGDLDALVVDLPSPPTRPQYVRPARRGPPLAPLVLAAFFVLSLPWLLGTAAWVLFAVGIALFATVAVLAIAAAPFILAVVLVVAAMRRRRHPLGWR
jgi:Domain of unknown function (DUF1707)